MVRIKGWNRILVVLLSALLVVNSCGVTIGEEFVSEDHLFEDIEAQEGEDLFFFRGGGGGGPCRFLC